MVIHSYPPITWEYLAGFFDGEGCIYWMKSGNRKYCIVHVSQGWVNENRSGVLQDILAFLLEHGINARKVSYTNANDHRVITSATIACRQWLEGMLPFLRVKRSAAETFLKQMEITNLCRITLSTRSGIIKRREEGISLNKIAEEFGVTKGTVRYNLIKYSNYAPLER
jgi:hypothetical protein